MPVTNQTPKQGGAGRGQGRKPADGVAKKERRIILFAPELYALAKRLGGGNASLGVSIALRQAEQQQQ